MSQVSSAGIGLRILGFAMGLFLCLMGVNKIAWFTDSNILVSQLLQWRDLASAGSLWYLETIALPGAPVFARLVPVAEMCAGVALFVGYRVRLIALFTLAMILNFHFASGVMFNISYFTNGYGPPVVGSLLALGLGGRRLPWSATS
ncbi:MAG: DoxX family membrane protein [Acidobacteriota bacterium]|nr:DoxX family membrane protein [Acidobacteriota bacterium]